MNVTEASITVSARVGFESVEQIPDRFAKVDFPIELALPWQYCMWEEAVPKWGEMVAALEEAELAATSVHATQGRISDPSFLTWGRQTCELAERLGARTVTVHPNRVKKTKPNSQSLAQQHIRALLRATGVMISVETFGGRDRVFTPDEVMAYGLPMTLDTAHLHDDERILRAEVDLDHSDEAAPPPAFDDVVHQVVALKGRSPCGVSGCTPTASNHGVRRGWGTAPCTPGEGR